MMARNTRLINRLFCDKEFLVDRESLGFIVRDLINMNWWNTSGVLLGYRKNRRVSGPFSEEEKRIAVQLKEFYRARRLAERDPAQFVLELEGYILGRKSLIPQLGTASMLTRANPSQYFHKADGTMTWVDCTSRATYAAKYVYQNGYGDFDGKLRVLGARKIIQYIEDGRCQDLGVSGCFEEGNNLVKAEIFSQKEKQFTVEEWVNLLGIEILDERAWLFDSLKMVRTDPFKKYEASQILNGTAQGVNEGLYGFNTSLSIQGARSISAVSSASNASRANRASHASAASDASHVSRASGASRASDASHVSRASGASRASDASRASNARVESWEGVQTAITKPDGLFYPKEFRKNIFALAGNWKINKDVVALAKIGWFDPFSGHGTSPLYAKRNGIKYLGFETNKAAFTEYLNTINQACARYPGPESKVELHDSCVLVPELIGKFDLCYTSPPYFNFEEYGGNTAHYQNCNSYAEFHLKTTVPVFTNVHKYLTPGGILAIQSEKDVTHKKLWIATITGLGFELFSDGVTGTENEKYSKMSKRDQSLLLFKTIN